MQGFTLHHNNIIRLIIARILLQKRRWTVNIAGIFILAKIEVFLKTVEKVLYPSVKF